MFENTLLTDHHRALYAPEIKELFRLCPETMGKKIERANVQQAFMLDKVRGLSNKETKILSVGSYQDTASEALLKLGYNITEIDPAINMDLDAFCKRTAERFHIVMSTSVMEHVQDDENFIRKICSILLPGGRAVLTCDFRDGWKFGDDKPKEDYRLYTKQDLLSRLNKVLENNNCSMFGDINYEGEPDFDYYGCKYSFATFMFVKNF